MTQPEILNEILRRVSAIEEELKKIQNHLDLPVNISPQQLSELENGIISRLDFSI